MREALPRYRPGRKNYTESPSKRRRLQGGGEGRGTDSGIGLQWTNCLNSTDRWTDTSRAPWQSGEAEKENFTIADQRQDFKLDFRTFKFAKNADSYQTLIPQVNKDQCFTFDKEDKNGQIAREENQFTSAPVENSQTTETQDSNKRSNDETLDKKIIIDKAENQLTFPNVVDSTKQIDIQVFKAGDKEWEEIEEIPENMLDVTTTEELVDQDMTTRIMGQQSRPRRPKSRASTLRSLLCCFLPIDDNFYNVSSCTINVPNT